MIAPVESLDHPLNPNVVGNKAAWLARMRQAGLRVPNAIALPACTETNFCLVQLELLGPSELVPQLEQFKNAEGTYPVAIRSSATNEDGTTGSMAGHFESYLGILSASQVAEQINRIYTHGFQALHNSGAMMGVVIQKMITPTLSGVAFSANPLTAQRGEITISFKDGFAADLVSGRNAGTEFVVRRDRPSGSKLSLPSTFPEAVALQLEQDLQMLETRYGHPVDVEWCVDQKGTLFYVQCRPIASLIPKQIGLLKVTLASKSIFPMSLEHHDKIAIRLLCEKRSVPISSAYVHIAFNVVEEEKVVLSDIRPSTDCVSFSTVLVHPKKLDGNIVRQFARNATTTEICVDRKCVRYAWRELASQADLSAKVYSIHELALRQYWVSAVIIQEIYEPRHTGIMKQVEDGIFIELAFGHFVPKGVVPTSKYRVDRSGSVLFREESFQKKAYYIENGTATERLIEQQITVSDDTLTQIARTFAPLLESRSSALEFGVLCRANNETFPYLIDLVDVSPDADVPSSLMETGVVSPGSFVGTLVHFDIQSLQTNSLHAHFHDEDAVLQSAGVPTIYHVSRPDIGLLQLLRSAAPETVAFVFDEGSFLSHFSIVLREKNIPAIVLPEAAAQKQGTLLSLDAVTANLKRTQRLFSPKSDERHLIR